MKKKLVIGVAQLLGAFAVLFVSTACFFLVHRPEIPAELKR